MPTELTAALRTKTGGKANKKLRETGTMPAVFYGPKDEATPIQLDTKAFEKAWKDAGESTVVTLKGLDTPKDTLIVAVDTDPIFGTPIHADLYAIDKDVAVEVSVPLVFTGVAPAEKELGGTLIKVLHEIDVEALPKDLPHEIEVDISVLKTFDDQLHVREIVMPAGVQAVSEAEEVVALVQAAVEEAEEAPSTDLSAIEVEKKGKEEAADTDSQ